MCFLPWYAATFLALYRLLGDHCSSHGALSAHPLAWVGIVVNRPARQMLWAVLSPTLDAQNALHHEQGDFVGSRADHRPGLPNDCDRGTLDHHDESTTIRSRALREAQSDFGPMSDRAYAVAAYPLAFSPEKVLSVQSHLPLRTQRRLLINVGYRASTDVRWNKQMKSLHPSRLRVQCDQSDARSLPQPWVIRN